MQVNCLEIVYCLSQCVILLRDITRSLNSEKNLSPTSGKYHFLKWKLLLTNWAD